jgi:Na+/melibiose symporter-like transporter
MFLFTQYWQLVIGYSPLGTAIRFLPIPPMMVIVATSTPRLAARFGAHHVVATGLALVALGFLAFRTLEVDTPYLQMMMALVPLNAGIALGISPITSSIMSAVPTRRAGTGSAMNDATRELGTALGVAVLGSLAASRYSHAFGPALDLLPADARGDARTSLAGAIERARNLEPEAGDTVTGAARQAFVDGIRFAALVAAIVAALAAVVISRLLPHAAAHETEAEAAERMAELGIGGTMPVVATDAFD